MSVFVLDQRKQPLMPCSEKRARLLLSRKRAIVHRVLPFTIRLKDRRVEDGHLQPLALKLDPGSKTTGMALARVEETEQGEVHHHAWANWVCPSAPGAEDARAGTGQDGGLGKPMPMMHSVSGTWSESRRVRA